jgi:hypothetical protein
MNNKLVIFCSNNKLFFEPALDWMEGNLPETETVYTSFIDEALRAMKGKKVLVITEIFVTSFTPDKPNRCNEEAIKELITGSKEFDSKIIFYGPCNMGWEIEDIEFDIKIDALLADSHYQLLDEIKKFAKA